MSRRKRIKWNPGDCFAIKLNNDKYAVVQWIEYWWPNQIYIVVTNILLKSLTDFFTLKMENILSLPALNKDPIEFGVWDYLGNFPAMVERKDFPNEKYKDNGYIGAKCYDAGLIEDFLNAYHGLTYWDDWFNPHYLDEFLIDIRLKPEKLLFKNSHKK